MTVTRDVVCTSCRKPKAQLRKRVSKVLPGTSILLCQDCLTNKREPRGFIVLAGIEFGLDHIAYWVSPKRYLGSDIRLEEIVKARSM